MDVMLQIESGRLDFSKWTKDQISKFIVTFEDLLLMLPQVSIPTKHYHAHDSYAREVEIPKGTLLTGAIYKNTHINILSKGEISILSIDDGMVRLKAPFTVVSPAGVKRLAYAHEDCVWTTIFGTVEKDVDKIQDEYTVKNMEDLKCQE
jgi:hypothetical protein